MQEYQIKILNSRHCMMVQEKLFKCGFLWKSGGKTFLNLDNPWLFLTIFSNGSKLITWDSKKDDNYVEITYNQLFTILIFKPKKFNIKRNEN